MLNKIDVVTSLLNIYLKSLPKSPAQDMVENWIDASRNVKSDSRNVRQEIVDISVEFSVSVAVECYESLSVKWSKTNEKSYHDSHWKKKENSSHLKKEKWSSFASCTWRFEEICIKIVYFFARVFIKYVMWLLERLLMYVNYVCC